MIPASNLLGIAAGLVALIALLTFLSALSMARWAQRATYYAVRREAQRTANRRLALAISNFVLAGALWVVSRLIPDSTPQPAPFAGAPAAEANRAISAMTPAAASPDITPIAVTIIAPATNTEPTPTTLTIASPTPPSSPQATPIPEPTSAPTGMMAAPAPPPSLATEAQAAPDKRLVLNAIANGIDANGMPMGVGTTFTRGVETIYIFFDFRDVPPSALLRHSWFRDGGSVFFRAKRLTRNGQGTDYVSWSPPGGFQPGLYEVRITLGGVPQFVANFEVR